MLFDNAIHRINYYPLAIGKSRIGPDRTGSDRIDKTLTESITPDNVLEFCAFLSCVVVSSFIETRRNVFLQRWLQIPKRNYDEFTSISELTTYTTFFFFKYENWRQFFTLPQSLLIARYPDLATERECQLMMASAAKVSILRHIRVKSQLFCGLSFRQLTLPFCC